MKTSVVVADRSFTGHTAPLRGSYAEVAAQAAAIGYQALQLTVNRPEEVSAAEVLRATEAHGLAVSSIATGLGYSLDKLCIGDREESQRQAASQRMCEHIELAAELGGARVIIGAIRGWARDCASWELYERQFRRSVEEMLELAEKRNIDVILEANDHLETDAFLSIAETAAYIQSFRSPRFKLHLDTMHMLYENEHPYDSVLPVAGQIAQVDISDEDRMAPDGKHFDFPRFIQALKDIHYDDYLVFEFREAPPAEAARVGYEYIQALL